jgi:hypothetical protein
MLQSFVFICGVNEDFELVEELLKVIPIKAKTGADDIFSQLAALLKQI